MTLPRALLCPRCGNSLEPLSSDLSTRCSRCHTEVKLDDPIARHYAPSPILAPNPRPAPRPVAPTPPAPPSPFWGRLRKALLPLCGAASGALLAQNAHIFRLQRGSAAPALHLAVLTGIVAITLLVTRRKILSAALAFAAGLLLALKPILRPLFYEDHAFSLTSETHLYFLLPGGALLVFGVLVLMSLPRKEQANAEKPEDRDGLPIRIVAASAMLLGLALVMRQNAGPTVAELIEQYQQPFAEVRTRWKEIHAKLPPPGASKVGKQMLSPAPVWDEVRPERDNIEILADAQLLDPDAKQAYGELYLSGDLLRTVMWTGPKNPMSDGVMGEQASEALQAEFQRALATKWLAVHRPAPGGREVLVLDAQTGEVVASTTTRGATSYETGRKAVLAGLADATGGTFRAR